MYEYKASLPIGIPIPLTPKSPSPVRNQIHNGIQNDDNGNDDNDDSRKSPKILSPSVTTITSIS